MTLGRGALSQYLFGDDAGAATIARLPTECLAPATSNQGRGPSICRPWPTREGIGAPAFPTGARLPDLGDLLAAVRRQAQGRRKEGPLYGSH